MRPLLFIAVLLCALVPPFLPRIAAAAAALVVAAGCVLALGQGVKHVVDNGFGSGDPRLLDQALAAMIVVAAALALATWFRFYLMMSTGERVITDLQRVSKPGCRIYCGKDQIPRVYGGLGINILSTSRGLMTGRSAAREGVGGEILCNIW